MSQLSYKNKPYLSQNIIKALEFASIAHRNQARVGPDKVPYISHPAAVGMVLWKAGFTDEVVMAGILHDVIEDTDYTYDDIQREFGKQIADWVAEVFEDAALPHDEKKEQYLTQLAAASMEAKAVSAADLLANRYSMLTGLSKDHIMWRNSPEKNMDRDRRRLEIVRPAISPELAEELEQTVNEVHRFFIKN